MNRKDIVIRAEKHVRELFQTHFKPEFVYHNLDHTERVVKAARQITGHYQMDVEDASAVFIAAWFHDTGYLLSSHEHEEISAELATTFLEGERAEESLIGRVEQCILATKIFKRSRSLTAKIVSDSDLFHLGTSEFWKSNSLMKQEMELRYKNKIPDERWNKGALRLLKRHQFETDYCRKLLQRGKETNINKLQKWLDHHYTKASNN